LSESNQWKNRKEKASPKNVVSSAKVPAFIK